MRTTRLLTTVAFAFASTSLWAQEYMEPWIWRNPKYDVNEHLYFDGTQYRPDYEAFLWKRNEASREQAWMVSTAREGVPVYGSPGGQPSDTKLPFGQELWVLAEKGEFIQINEKRKGPALGWVHKRDLVLWSTPLVDRNTGIEIKAFVVNTTRSGSQMKVNKEKYKVYDSPTGEHVLKENYIYDVLFVYRYERGKDGRAGRYLVSPHYELNSFHKLAGWISEERVKIWSTSLCIEPNWDRDAIRERQQAGIEAKVFAVEMPGAQDKMQEYVRTGKGQGLVGGKYRDPAFVPDEIERNPRMTGKVFRYPVFGGTMKGTDNCEFLTGVSAKINMGNTNMIEGIDQDSYVEISRRHDLIKEQMGQVNIVFVVEATAGMQGYVKLASDQIRALARRQQDENRFSFGAVVYRNDLAARSKDQETEENYLSAFGLSDDAAKVADWMGKQIATDAGDLEDTQAMHFALKRAIGLMKNDQANILVHITRSPDHASSDFPDRDRKTFVSITDLGRTLEADKEVHYIGYTAHTNPDPVLREDAFNWMHNTVMSSFANTLSKKFVGALGYIAEGLKPQAPRTIESEVNGVRTMGMHPSYFYMRSHLITSPDQMNTMGRSVAANIDSCLAMNERFMGYMDLIVEDESATADMTGEFTSSAFLLAKLIPDNLDKAQKDAYIKYFEEQKVQVFADAQTVYKAGSLRQPLFRYVLFMPEERLSQRYNQLNNIVTAINKMSAEEVRKKVKESWEESAKDVLGGKDFGQLGIADLQVRMLGIEKMDIIRPFNTGQLMGNVRINDVDDPRKFSDMQFQQYLDRLKLSLAELKKIRESDNFYQVVGDMSTKFYWVPVEFYFD